MTAELPLNARYIVGDSLTVLRTLPDESVDLVLCSPAFLALRSYLPADHPDKDKEMGSEPTPGEWLDALLDVVEECWRVLAPHGSICVELGDTYAGSGGAGGDYGLDGMRGGQEKFDGSARRGRARVGGKNGKPSIPGRKHYTVDKGGEDWPLDKSLCLVPELFRFALAYGFNPLTGRQTPRWRVRNVIRWCRPNPPVGALGDKVRPATTDMVVACKGGEVGRRRWFDLDSVRQPYKPVGRQPAEKAMGKRIGGNADAYPDDVRSGWTNHGSTLREDRGGAPPLDHWWHDDVLDQDAWYIPTQPYKGAHFATWPAELCRKPILMMCPPRVCVTCGKPGERIVDAVALVDGKPSDGRLNGRSVVQPWREESATHQAGRATFSRLAKTVGWSHCECGEGCTPTTWRTDIVEIEQGLTEEGQWFDLWHFGEDDPPVKTRKKRKRVRVLDRLGECRDPTHWRRGRVLDPFAGSGTTLQVAVDLGRDSIGIDIDETNAELAEQRVGGLFLTVERHQPTGDLARSDADARDGAVDVNTGGLL